MIQLVHHWFRIGFELGVVCLCLCGFVAVGLWLLRPARPEPESALGRLLLALALGSGAMALATYALAKAQLLYWPVFWGLTLAVVLAGRRALARLAGDVVRQFGSMRVDEPWPFWAGAVLGVPTILICVLYAFMPQLVSDATAVHMAIPRLYMLHHGFVPVDFMHFGYWPHVTEMTYLYAMLLGRSLETCGLMHGLFFVALALAVFELVRRRAGTGFGMLAAGAFLVGSNFNLVHYFAGVKEEYQLAFYGVVMFMALVDHLRTARPGHLWLAGALAGFAAGCKLIFGLVPLGALACMLVLAAVRKRTPVRVLVLHGGGALILALALAGVWHVDQVVRHGDPFYPFSIVSSLDNGNAEALGGAAGNPQLQSAASRYVTEGAGPLETAWDLAAGLPRFMWDMTTRPDLFELSTVSMAFSVMLAFLVLPARPWDRLLKDLLVFAALLFGVYYLGPSSVRRYILLLAALAGILAMTGWSLRGRRRLFAAYMLVMALILAGDAWRNVYSVRLFGGLGKIWPVLVGAQSRSDYLDGHTYGAAAMARYANANLEPGARIFCYPMFPGAYLERDFVYGDALQAMDYMGYADMHGPDDLLARLRDMGVTHLCVARGVWPARNIRGEAMVHGWVTDIMARRAGLVFQYQGYALFELEYDAPGRVAAVIPGEPGQTIPINPFQHVFTFHVTGHSPDRAYRLRAEIEVKGDRPQSPNGFGPVLLRRKGEADFTEVAVWNPAMYGAVDPGRGTPVSLLLAPFIDGDGDYELTFWYEHSAEHMYMVRPVIEALAGRPD